MRGIDVRNILAAEQIFHLAHFKFALGVARIAAVGLAFVADGGEAVRVDGQAEQFVRMGAQSGRQGQVLHVVFGQRVIGRADTELHGHIQTGGRFAAARHAHQNQIGLVVVVGAGAIIVVEGKVHRLDTLHIVGVMPNGMGLSDRIGGMFAQLLFQWRQERGENVDHETIRGCENLTNVLIDDGVENDRPKTVFFSRQIDLLYHGPRFFHAVDVRPREFGEGNVFELREQALTQCFGCNAGAVGNKESRSFHLSPGP